MSTGKAGSRPRRGAANPAANSFEELIRSLSDNGSPISPGSRATAQRRARERAERGDHLAGGLPETRSKKTGLPETRSKKTKQRNGDDARGATATPRLDRGASRRAPPQSAPSL